MEHCPWKATMAGMSKRPKVVVAEPIAEAGVKALEACCDVDLAVDARRPDLLRRLADANGLVVRSATDVDAELIAAATQLRVIGRAGIGVDNIDVAAATAAGILVVNAPDANSISAAEHTLALLLAQARRVPEADRSMRDGAWERKKLQGVELHGKRLGVVGLGRIGTLVAERARAFGMELMAYDPYVGGDHMERLDIQAATSLEQVLTMCDFVTVHLPLTQDTRGIIGADEFEVAKPGLRIVNTSRGGIIDEAALAEAVRSGRVAGAALDVFETEPLGESPLRELPEVVLTPHLGASTREAQDKAGAAVAEAVAQALRGELVASAVNLDIGLGLEPEAKPYLPVAEHLGEIMAVLARGLPDELTVRAEGELAELPLRPFVLCALRGALTVVSDVAVSYVNARVLAAQRGIAIREEAALDTPDYRSVLRLSGTVNGKPISIAGAVIHRGPALVEINGYEIELPITRHLLVVRIDDTPGVIGRLGVYLGSEKVNIADMAVGRSPKAEAMMGLNLDESLSPDQVAAIQDLDGIIDARFIALSERG